MTMAALAGTFEIFTGPNPSFARFTKDESAVFVGKHALQSGNQWFLPDVSIDRSDGYYNAVFYFRTSLGQSDQDSGFLRLKMEKRGSALKEYERGPCSKRVVSKDPSFESLLIRFGGGQ
jgi:hypothetical protein